MKIQHLIYLFSTLILLSCTTKTAKENIHTKAQNGDIEAVKQYIADGRNIESRYRGSKMIDYAIRGGHYDIVEYLINQGQNLNISNGRSPLINAALEGNFDIVKLLVEKGADVNVMDGSKVLDEGTSLLVAAKKRDTLLVNYLLKNGADINQKDKYLNTALHKAVFSYEMDEEDIVEEQKILRVVKVLLEKGANVNLTDNRNSAALNIAALREHVSVVEYLLDNGAEINNKGENGNTALSYTVSNDNFELFNLLIKRDANHKLLLDNGQNLLFEAVGSLEMMEMLINEFDLDVKHIDSLGKTTLMYAAKYSSKGVIDSLLFKYQMDINQVDFSGRTALHAALEGYDNFEVIEYLLDKGADINIIDKDGFNMLSYFTWVMICEEEYYYPEEYKKLEEYNRRIIRLLLSNNVSKSHKNKFGKRAYDYASKGCHQRSTLNLLK